MGEVVCSWGCNLASGALCVAVEVVAHEDGRLLLNVVALHRAVVLQMLALEEETLLGARDALPLHDPRLEIVDELVGEDAKVEGLPAQCPDEDLHDGACYS